MRLATLGRLAPFRVNQTALGLLHQDVVLSIAAFPLQELDMLWVQARPLMDLHIRCPVRLVTLALPLRCPANRVAPGLRRVVVLSVIVAPRLR